VRYGPDDAFERAFEPELDEYPMTRSSSRPDATRRRRVLFLCTHNSARSQVAEGLLRSFHGDRYEAFSAGTEATFVKESAIEVMAEIGVDISGQTSKTLDLYLEEPMDVVVTVCDSANEACPVFPNARERIHREFEDPSLVESPPEARREAFRRARDEIRAWIDETFGA
jgi:arsenate reductase